MADNVEHNDNSYSDAFSAATLSCTQATISLVPADPAFSVCRFLSDRDQRPPPGMKQTPSEAEAESKMLTELNEFDVKFGNSPEGRSSTKT